MKNKQTKSLVFKSTGWFLSSLILKSKWACKFKQTWDILIWKQYTHTYIKINIIFKLNDFRRRGLFSTALLVAADGWVGCSPQARAAGEVEALSWSSLNVKVRQSAFLLWRCVCLVNTRDGLWESESPDTSFFEGSRLLTTSTSLGLFPQSWVRWKALWTIFQLIWRETASIFYEHGHGWLGASPREVSSPLLTSLFYVPGVMLYLDVKPRVWPCGTRAPGDAQGLSQPHLVGSAGPASWVATLFQVYGFLYLF